MLKPASEGLGTCVWSGSTPQILNSRKGKNKCLLCRRTPAAAFSLGSQVL
jgi:hypothetical protein